MTTLKTTLNTLTAINAAEKSGLFAIMNEIKEQAPEIAETMIENCTQHFNGVIHMVGNGKDEKTIGTQFGCGEIDAFQLFTMVAGQAMEDLAVYIAKRDVEPMRIVAGQVEFGDRILNAYTGDFEVVNDVYQDGDRHQVTIRTKKDTKLTLSIEIAVTIKR